MSTMKTLEGFSRRVKESRFEVEFHSRGCGIAEDDGSAAEGKPVVVDAEGVGDAVSVGFAGCEGVVVVAAGAGGEIEGDGIVAEGGWWIAVEGFECEHAGDGAGVLGELGPCSPSNSSVGGKRRRRQGQGDGHERKVIKP
jgi:hypothetical protein